MTKTTNVEITTSHKLTLQVIEMAVYQATKRVREGSAILPEQQDRQAAHQVISKLLEENKHLEEYGLTLIDIYLFTLAQATSAMVTLFDDTSIDSEV